MRKIKLKELIGDEFQISFAELMASETPMSTAYALVQIAEKVAEEQNRFETLRKKLLGKYGEKDPEGNLKVVSEEYVIADRPRFDAEYKSLLEVEVEIPQISFTDLGLTTIKPTILAVLMKTVIDGSLS